MRIKLLRDDAIVPTRATDGSGGYDLFVPPGQDPETEQFETVWSFGLGFAVEIPDGWVGLIKDRSSVFGGGFTVLSGVIDSDYRGEVIVKLKQNRVPGLGRSVILSLSQSIAQLVVVPHWCKPIEVTDHLEPTARGTGGFGSTGR